MNYLKILNSKEKEKIIDKLNFQFGITKVKGLLVKRGEENFFLFQGEFDKKQIKNLEHTIQIERIGIYFAKQMKKEIILSLEGTQILKSQITKSVFELNKEQMQDWMQGKELNIKTGKKGFLIMKYKNDFLGCGKASELKIRNFIPKNRRLKRRLF